MRRVFWLILWRAKKPLKLTLLWISRSSHYTSHICAAQNTWWTPGNQQGSMIRTKQKSRWTHIHKNTGINLGHIKQQLSTTKRALAGPACAALLLPGPGHQWGEAAPSGEKNQESLTPLSAMEVQGRRKTTTGCCFLMLFTSQQRKHCCSTQG